MHGAESDDYYTILLMNPDDFVPIAPVLHNMIVNVKGSDLQKGFSNVDTPRDATTVSKYFRPNPPLPWSNLTYVYLVFKQLKGETDYSELVDTVIPFGNFDVEGTVKTYKLKLVASNYWISW